MRLTKSIFFAAVFTTVLHVCRHRNSCGLVRVCRPAATAKSELKDSFDPGAWHSTKFIPTKTQSPTPARLTQKSLHHGNSDLEIVLHCCIVADELRMSRGHGVQSCHRTLRSAPPCSGTICVILDVVAQDASLAITGRRMFN